MLGLKIENMRYFDLVKLSGFLNSLYVEKEFPVEFQIGNSTFERKTKETVWVLKTFADDFAFITNVDGNICGAYGKSFSYYEDYFYDIQTSRELPVILFDFEQNINILSEVKRYIKSNWENLGLIINRSFDDDRMRLLSHILKLENDFQKDQENYKRNLDSFEIVGGNEHPELMDITKDDEIKLVVNGKEYDISSIRVFNR